MLVHVCVRVCVCICVCVAPNGYDYERKLQSICYVRSPSFTSEIFRFERKIALAENPSTAVYPRRLDGLFACRLLRRERG